MTNEPAPEPVPSLFAKSESARVPSAAADERRLLTWWLAILLALVTVVLYWPAVHFDFVSFDDGVYVTTNPRVLGGLNWENATWAFTTGRAGNWHPLTWLSLMLDASLFGGRAGGFHLTNLCLHALNVVLLFALLERLTGARWRSAAVAAFFGWHPLHVESVAWVSERKDVLSAAFGLLSLLFYTRYAQARPAGTEKMPPDGAARWYWFSLGALTLGLLSKSMLVTWPLVMLLLDYWPLRRWQPGRMANLLREKLPFLAVAVASAFVTFFAQRHGGYLVTMQGLPVGLRMENALVSYGRYLGKLFWPGEMAIFYPLPNHWPERDLLVGVVVLGGLSALAIGGRRSVPFLLVGWLWYIVTLTPVIGLVQVGGQAMADRYTYLPSIGVLVLVVWGAHALTRRWHQPAVAWAMVAAACGCCLVATRQQLAFWRNSEAVFGHALAVTTDNYSARNGMGLVLAGQGRWDEAVIQYREALRIDPAYAEAHNNLGVALISQGQKDVATSEFREALRLSPEYPQAHGNLALALVLQGKTDEAISEFQASLRLDPNAEPIRYQFGLALARRGRADETIAQWQECIRLNPNEPRVRDQLGMALAAQGQITDAIDQFQEALRLKPDFADAQNNLNRALALQSRSDMPAP